MKEAINHSRKSWRWNIEVQKAINECFKGMTEREAQKCIKYRDKLKHSTEAKEVNLMNSILGLEQKKRKKGMYKIAEDRERKVGL